MKTLILFVMLFLSPIAFADSNVTESVSETQTDTMMVEDQECSINHIDFALANVQTVDVTGCFVLDDGVYYYTVGAGPNNAGEEKTYHESDLNIMVKFSVWLAEQE